MTLKGDLEDKMKNNLSSLSKVAPNVLIDALYSAGGEFLSSINLYKRESEARTALQQGSNPWGQWLECFNEHDKEFRCLFTNVDLSKAGAKCRDYAI